MIPLFRVPWNTVLAVIVFCMVSLSTVLECFEMGFMLCKHSVDSIGDYLCGCFDLPLPRSRRTDAGDHLLWRRMESGMAASQ